MQPHRPVRPNRRRCPTHASSLLSLTGGSNSPSLRFDERASAEPSLLVLCRARRRRRRGLQRVAGGRGSDASVIRHICTVVKFATSCGKECYKGTWLRMDLFRKFAKRKIGDLLLIEFVFVTPLLVMYIFAKIIQAMKRLFPVFLLLVISLFSCVLY